MVTLCCSGAGDDGATSVVNLILFRPPRRTSAYYIPSDVIQLETRAGNQICATAVEKEGSAVWILLSHANAEDLNTVYRSMLKLSILLDVNVIGYDYSGYGLSTGKPCESNCYADIDSVFEYLTKVRNIPPEHVVLYGRSLGSGPSCYLAAKTCAAKRPVAGLILQAPFTSVYRVVLPDIFGCTALGDLFPNIDRMEDIECPVFIAHGEEDAIVPCQHGRALFKAAAAFRGKNSAAEEEKKKKEEVRMKAEFFTTKGLHHNYYENVHVEQQLMEALNQYLDYHILARRLWMR